MQRTMEVILKHRHRQQLEEVSSIVSMLHVVHTRTERVLIGFLSVCFCLSSLYISFRSYFW